MAVKALTLLKSSKMLTRLGNKENAKLVLTSDSRKQLPLLIRTV